MDATKAPLPSERYTGLSDRFRSLWTFYQFLVGVFNHQGKGQLPFKYDFQALYRKIQALVPQLGQESTVDAGRDLDNLERELKRIHQELARIEVDFAPSLLRRFFDHLKRQDEKILFALVKFYLQADQIDAEYLDKMDILLTRVSENTTEEGRILPRGTAELTQTFERLSEFTALPAVTDAEVVPLIETVKAFRSEMTSITDFDKLLISRVFDRFRDFKHDLGMLFLHPPLLLEIVRTNIEAKSRFRILYEEEEPKILEDTNRIFEIERYLEKNPDVAHEELKRQIEVFRRFRLRFDSSRRENNVKREDILELRRAMQRVHEEFGPLREAAVGSRLSHDEEPAPAATPPQAMPSAVPPAVAAAGPSPAFAPAPVPVVGIEPAREPSNDPFPNADPESVEELVLDGDGTSITDLMPADPLLNETLHKIAFALELVVWDRTPEQAVTATEIHHLNLEPWEVDTYRRLAEGDVPEGTVDSQIERFFLSSAALRVKMEEEAEEIVRLSRGSNGDRLFELLEKSAQSLERAREVNRRFQWFIDDMLYRGETQRLEQIYRSHFRFMKAFSHLWLDHQASGGITPL